MLPGDSPVIPDNRIYRRTTWERVPLGAGGFFFPEVTLGAKISSGQRLGFIVSPLDNENTVVSATCDGTIIGMARAQIVLSGYALFHLGLGGQSSVPDKKELREQEKRSVVRARERIVLWIRTLGAPIIMAEVKCTG